jgi:hypothetical protein
MEGQLVRLIWSRAGHCCEYCRIPQLAVVKRHQIEHITARQHGGDTVPDNLALACERCNSFKGPNLTGIDPVSNTIVRLFHPRLEPWDEHFEFQGEFIAGLTPTGRATVELLRMNSAARVKLRKELAERGEL